METPSTSPFRPQPMQGAQLVDKERLTQAYENVLVEILDTLNSGRYSALAVTALEESAMWVSKSLAFEGGDSVG